VFPKITLSIMAEACKKRNDLSLQGKQIILECYDKLPKMFHRIKHFTTTFMKDLKQNISDVETLVLTNKNTDRKRVVV
jgi:hypothetical protein